jgi:predicted DsbA family dithiol-disulfide isomerase
MPENKVITVEIYADIICPWCYIGKRRLDAAFAARPHITPRYIWRAFLLNPGMPENGMDRQTYLDNKFGSAAAAVYGRIAAAGLESGIEFNFDKIMRTPDSRKAHQLLLSGAPYTDRLSEALYQAYFIDGKDIGNDDSLNDIIKAAGIKIDPAVAASSAIRKQLENDLFMARQLQLDGVPYFIFAEQFAVAGAHMPEHLIPVIDAAAA